MLLGLVMATGVSVPNYGGLFLQIGFVTFGIGLLVSYFVFRRTRKKWTLLVGLPIAFFVYKLVLFLIGGGLEDILKLLGR